MTHCPRCKTAFVKKSQDGKIRVRTRIVAFDQGAAEGVCTKCGATIPLPLELTKSLAIVLQSRRLVVRARKNIDSSKPQP